MRNINIDTLNALLRGELAATETYEQALEKVTAEPQATKLRRVQFEHREAANRIRDQLHRLGGNPVNSSGAWGALARMVEGTAKLFGEAAAIRVLKEGEQTGLHSYEDALEKELAPECKSLIRSALLPQTREHIHTLDQLIAAQ